MHLWPEVARATGFARFGSATDSRPTSWSEAVGAVRAGAGTRQIWPTVHPADAPHRHAVPTAPRTGRMPRRRSGTRALKSWTTALRAAMRLAGSAAYAGRRLGAIGLPASKSKPKPAIKKKPRTSVPEGSATPAAHRAGRLPKSVEVGQFRNAFGTRSYRLYRPETSPESGARPPLLVMLHGCTQDAAGFARITRMASLAGAQGCWVLFPEQSAEVNRGRCWQWFEPGHQQRGAGEPAILAGMVRKLVREHQLDGQRVFVAGLSAGGAMAVILGRVYPDLFKAVGVCAGMPHGSARNAATAMLAMRGRHGVAGGPDRAGGSPGKPVRTIVVHGDRDRTVSPRNATAIVDAALDAFGPTTDEQEAGTAGGRNVIRVRYRTESGLVAAEAWTIHGAGHVWCGGAPGTFSDPRGPDVSAVMLRFFLKP